MNPAALIFSHSITPRIQYVVDFLSGYYGLTFKIILDEEKYRNATEVCKINYSYHRIVPGEIFIHSHVLLFETTVRPVKIACFSRDLPPAHPLNTILHDGYKAFFKTEGDFGFDIFAGIFYLISRYEEYLPYKKDQFGRFPHEASLAFKENFLDLPLVNIWLEDFRLWLSEKNSAFRTPHSAFQFLPTYDIDIAWSFRNKGFAINAAGVLKLLLRLKFGQASQRIKIIRKKSEDPFDAYAWMDELHQRYHLTPVYFFLVAIEKGKHDKNIDVNNIEFRQLIKSIAEKYATALHPSWASGDDASLVIKEKQLLEKIIERGVDTSRQHFIRMGLPFTYQKLLQAGIVHDHSMGYGGINGFRASFSNSFFWYDLRNESATTLQIHPYCFMDANAYYEQKQSPEKALQEMMHYYKMIKSVNGTMITLWHNSFLGTGKEFEGWREVYEEFVVSIVNRE